MINLKNQQSNMSLNAKVIPKYIIVQKQVLIKKKKIQVLWIKWKYKDMEWWNEKENRKHNRRKFGTKRKIEIILEENLVKERADSERLKLESPSWWIKSPAKESPEENEGID